MNNFAKLLISLLCVFCLSGCGGSSVKIDSSLTKEEAQAVKITEKLLPSGGKIQEYEIITEKLPLAILDEEYKNVRDQVNKARLDYRTCMVRGLEQSAQKNVAILENIQATLIEKIADIETSSPDYLFVLAKVKERNRKDGKLTGVIAIFEPTTLEQVDFIQVTTPLYNNAVMMTQAQKGTLADPDSGSNTEALTSSDPVINFILTSDPK